VLDPPRTIQSRRYPLASRVLGAFAVTATAALATLVLATPASAHSPTSNAYCDAKAKKTVLSVSLTYYVGNNNKVVVTDGDKELKNLSFSQNWSYTPEGFDPTVDHKFRIVVTPGDGKGAYDKTHTVYKCVEKTPDKPKPEQPKPEQPKPEQPKPEQPKPEEPQPPVVTTTEAPSSSATPPAPGGSTPEPPLAATGASPLWLLVSGVGLVGAGAGTLLFLRRRRSA
jgi:LPXTG-motif cell wall-anchored protein